MSCHTFDEGVFRGGCTRNIRYSALEILGIGKCFYHRAFKSRCNDNKSIHQIVVTATHHGEVIDSIRIKVIDSINSITAGIRLNACGEIHNIIVGVIRKLQHRIAGTTIGVHPGDIDMVCSSCGLQIRQHLAYTGRNHNAGNI